MATEPPPSEKSRRVGCFAVVIILGLLLVFIVGPITPGTTSTLEPGALQQEHAIGLAMVAYANDHHGSYPDGKTSTEVFQKLLDGHYIDDPTIFYHRSIPGKTRATTSTLTVNNVCFDVTSGVTKDSPDGLPVIFSSGYTVTYAPGASAARDPNSPTPFNGDGIALGYISRDHPEYGLACQFSISAPDGSIPKFIPETFDAGGKTYRQLRP